MDTWVRIEKKRVAVIIIMSFFLLLFPSSFVYGQWWDSVNPPSVSSSWSLSGVHFTSATEGWAVGYAPAFQVPSPLLSEKRRN